ncbi:MAG: DNA repair protein RecN [Desulfuromonas sp.]|nr:MAG: DNA repair protein RecN [Desulfuromonas sp.]
MLTDLRIQNFALIEQLHVQFAGGFNVLTGETGAGKSIIIDAVNLLLGGRARGDVIRTGSDEAVVEALFDLAAEPRLRARLEEQDLADGDDLLVRRIVSRSGKNRVFVNGMMTPLGQLRGLTSTLVNIYGQHEHQALQKTDSHLALLDRFAHLDAELDDYRQAYRTYHQIVAQIDALDIAERDRQQRLDMLRFQQQELSAAALVAGEDTELEQERVRLQNAGKLSEASHGGYQTLYAEKGAVCERLTAIADDLAALKEIEPAFVDTEQAVRSALYGLEDAAVQLRDYADGLSFEPQRMATVDDRLALLKTLKRKYAPTVAELIDYQNRVEAELAVLDDVDGRRADLAAELSRAGDMLNRSGAELSRLRQAGAASLAEAVQRELADLAMPKACFEVRLTATEQPSSDGLESGEFYLSANPGEALQPLARVASGGELSRIMLALKRTSPEGDGVHTLVFDEVDAGIGGEAATAVGEKIGRLAHRMQVLCVTHLPQVAAFADQHFQVAKQEQDGRTLTGLHTLEGDARVREMARMLGGAQVTERTLEHARELLSQSSVALRAAMTMEG